MGKQKSKGPNLVAVPNKDLMQRMNFLYQVASHLSQQSGLFEENSDVKPSPKGSKKAKKRNGTPQDLAAFHVRSMKAIGTKSMVKMDPAVKRSICKVCFIVMLPGATLKTRIKASRAHRFVTVQTCANCGWARRIPSPPQPIEDAMQVESGIEDNTPKRRRRIATELSEREMRRVRPPPLFKRTGHVVQLQTPNKVQIVGV